MLLSKFWVNWLPNSVPTLVTQVLVAKLLCYEVCYLTRSVLSLACQSVAGVVWHKTKHTGSLWRRMIKEIFVAFLQTHLSFFGRT